MHIRPPVRADETEFLAAVRRSRVLHHPWVKAPDTSEAFVTYVMKQQNERFTSFLICFDEPSTLIGVVNLSEIVLGSFRSAYLSYYAFLPHAGRGLMKDGLAEVVTHAFTMLKLHRLEANIQPRNLRSKALVKKLGFRREGLSRRYLKINGRWRDHERWAILAEDW
ncbi:MAG TPA: GNAT family protein [Vicinamibacterales bacterium]|nr:GNAT family protein [Vicinamibacterales bacterium]